jgi:hypothetical protein
MSRATSSANSVTSQQQHGAMSIPRDRIAMRAYEKWCKRGRPHGSDKQDWIEAEKELMAEMNRAAGAQARR